MDGKQPATKVFSYKVMVSELLDVAHHTIEYAGHWGFTESQHNFLYKLEALHSFGMVDGDASQKAIVH